VIDGALATAQLLVTSSVVLPPVVPKIALIAVAVAVTLVNQRWQAPSFLTVWVTIFTIYLYACSSVWPASADPLDSEENLLLYHTGFILLALSFCCAGGLSERTIALAIVSLSIPLAVLGIAQHLSGNPLLPQDLESVSSSTPEDYFGINSPGFYGQLRGFSLFTSGLNFGHFLNLAVAILTPLFCTLRGYSRLKVALLLTLCGAGVYSTLTRAVYVQLAFVISSALLFVFIPKTRRLLGLLTLVFGILAAVLVTLIEPLQELNSGDILASDSMVLRLAEWARCWEDLTNDTVSVLLLGTGFMQGKSLIIDNGPIAVAYQAGIIGLLIWVVGIVIVLRYVKQRLAASPSYFTIGIAAYITSWLCATMFNVSTDDGPRIAILLVLCQSGTASGKGSQIDRPERDHEMIASDGWSRQLAPPRGPAPLNPQSVAFAADPSSGKRGYA